MRFNLTSGVTPVSHAIYDLHMIIFWICVVIGVVVFGAMFYALWFHRKSKGYKAAEFHEHFWLEITWTIVPFIILVIMAIPATKVLMQMSDSAEPDLTVKITGYQWKWRYEYLDHKIQFFSNITTPFNQIHNLEKKSKNYLIEVDHPIVVPIHKKIRFLITSNDVIHSWWVPDLGVKRDAVPGFINEAWTKINRAGTYHGQCAELCGVNHAYMPIVVNAVSEKEFANWVIQQQGGTVAPPAPPTAVAPTSEKPAASLPPVGGKLTMEQLMKRGEQIYLNTCATCHKPDGSGMPPVFPPLRGSKVATGPVAGHIHIVLFGRPGTAMQPFKDQFSDEEIAAVITYERNAIGNSTKDIVQPADVTTEKTKG